MVRLGGYVIGLMTDDGARVFVDGRNDMYSEEILNDYNTHQERGARLGGDHRWL